MIFLDSDATAQRIDPLSASLLCKQNVMRLNSQQNVDFHFVRCFNWMMAGWKTPELLEHLLRFAAESTEGPEGLSAPESVDELPR